MRIGWATPFNVQSAIGTFSLMVCEELRARGHAVDIIRIESGEERDAEAIPCDFAIRHAADADVDDYDRLIVNLGNHAPYHAHAMTLMGRRAPLGIFHDMEMRDYEKGLAHHYHFVMPRLIGVDDESARTDLGDMVEKEARPTLGTLAAMTSGAIVHGPHYQPTVAAFCPGPVDVIPLCFPDVGKGEPTADPRPGRRVAVFGVLNANKQVGRVLEALARLRDFGAVELHLAGSSEDHVREAIEAKARLLGLAPPIFHGFVSNARLQDILDESHAICCLRFPVTEGGSASLVTALYRARPLIVSDVASYAMVPDDLVAKISYGDDPRDLAAALRTIFTDPAGAMERAGRARDWARGRFSARSYVDALEPIVARLDNSEILARTARDLVAAVTSPRHEPMAPAISAFAEVLDWMHASQDE